MKARFPKSFVSILLYVLLILFLSGAATVESQVAQPEFPPISHPDFPSNCIRGVDCDAGGNCWFASWAGVYARSSQGAWTTFTPANSGLAHPYCTDVSVDSRGYVWVTHQGGGVSLLNHNGTISNLSDDAWRQFTTADGLGSNSVETVEFDSQGLKWFGHWNGISVLNDKGTPLNKSDDDWQEHPAGSNGLVNSIINAIVFNTKELGRAYAGGDFGLSRQSTSLVWITLTWPGSHEWPPESEKNFSTWDLAMDYKDHMWAATWDMGVGEYDGIGWQVYEEYNSDLPYNNVRSVAVDVNNNKWFGTENGVARLDGFGEWTVYTKSTDAWLGSDWIDSIDFDTNGHGLFGSCGDAGGISEYIPDDSDHSFIYPGMGGEVFSPDRGAKVEFPAGAVTQPTEVTYTIEGTPPTGDLIGVRFFNLTAVISGTTTPVTETNLPYSVTVLYTEQGAGSVIQDTLALYAWDDTNELWTQEGITSTTNITENVVTAQLSHLSIFGVLGETNWIYLPLVSK